MESVSCSDKLYDVYPVLKKEKLYKKIFPLVVPSAYEKCGETMIGIQALSPTMCNIWFCLLGVTLAIMMLQLMCMWSGYSINNSTYCSFLGICMWLPLILVTYTVQNEENQCIIPSVSSACNSHNIKIIFIMLLPLSNHHFLQSSIFFSYFSLHQYVNISCHSMLTIFQETVERQNWFTQVPCSICHTILLFIFRAGCA